MANPQTVFPTSVTEVDDRAGNTFLIMEVNHTTGKDTNVIVPDSAVSVAELPSSNGVAPTFSQGSTGSDTAAVDPAADAIIIHNTVSGDSGAGFTFAADDGVKQVIMDTDAATGTYIIVVRCIGSAAGTGSTGAGGQ